MAEEMVELAAIAVRPVVESEVDPGCTESVADSSEESAGRSCRLSRNRNTRDAAKCSSRLGTS